MEDYNYTGVFRNLSYRSALISIGGINYRFSLKYCHFDPDPLDLKEGDIVTVECPCWLSDKMGIDGEKTHGGI